MKFSKLKLLVLILGFISIEKAIAQTNESSVTNSAAPSASSVTTGGTNINYQTNNITDNFSVNAGILFPFGSSVQDDCKKLASTITLDRMISSELSMLKACNELYQKNIPVDPDLFPLLKKCSNYKPKEKNMETANIPKNDTTIIEKEKTNELFPKNEKSKLIPKSFRAL